MNQQPDKLFKDKLHGYGKPAPKQAWGRIEAGLQNKNVRNLLWLKIAAAVTLLALTMYLFIPAPQVNTTIASTDVKDTLAKAIEEKMQRNPNDDKTHGESKSTSVPVNKMKEEQALPTKKSRKIKRSRRSKIEVKAGASMKTQLAKRNLKRNGIIDSVKIEMIPTGQLVATANKVEAAKSNALVFTAAETNKYLKKDAIAQATSNNKKTSTIKKLLDKASDIKSNNDPLGDLRQMKDEILALNFKPKDRRQ